MTLSIKEYDKVVRRFVDDYVNNLTPDQLRENEQYQDADAIAQEYVCKGEVEDDNYQWLYVNYQFKEAN